jgi:hypothetical protein
LAAAVFQQPHFQHEGENAENAFVDRRHRDITRNDR